MNSRTRKMAEISWVLLDIDGVLTDGRVGYAADGEEEIKFFDVKDGHAVKLLQQGGIIVGALSGRKSRANFLRARELGLDFLYQNEKDKLAAFEKIQKEQQLPADKCLCIGDDLMDIPVMRRCALAAAVADCVPELQATADFITEARGGRGAVREVAVELLKAKGTWERVIQKYYR